MNLKFILGGLISCKTLLHWVLEMSPSLVATNGLCAWRAWASSGPKCFVKYSTIAFNCSKVFG